MNDSVIIYLPTNSYVNVNGFTNSFYTQQVTIEQENGNKQVMTGNGEHDAPMQNGSYAIITPASSKNPMGYQVTVTVQSQQGGKWVPSKVTSGMTSLMYYNMVLVVSEDSGDNDWNDANVQFSWWTKPS